MRLISKGLPHKADPLLEEDDKLTTSKETCRNAEPVMNHKRKTSFQIRLASIAILMLLIILAAVAYSRGRKVETDSDLIMQDAVPGTISAHYMRMAMSRSLTLALVAASAKTTEFRDGSLKAVHEADVAFTAALKNYEDSIGKNPQQDRSLLDRVKKGYATFNTKRIAFEALILAWKS